MVRIVRFIAIVFAALGLAASSGSVLAQGKGKDKDRKEQREDKEKGGGKEKKAKQHKHQDGKSMVGDKIKKNGRHKIHEHGKHSAFVDVQDGKIRGVKVTHADKGDVPVKKYKTNKKMAEGQPSLIPVQYGTQYLGQTWIGYAYIDDWGDEVIYWFPYDMIYDGDTGAIEYVPAY